MKILMTILLTVALSLWFAIYVQEESEYSNSEPESVAEQIVADADWPVDVTTRLTTSGDIYMANLDSQINALQQILLQRSSDILLSQLALAKYHRFQVLGQLADAEQALQLLQTVTVRKHNFQVDLALVQIHMGFHQFDAAQQALNTAKENGAALAQVNSARQALDRAVGTDLAVKVINSGHSVPSTARVTRAADLIERGEFVQASLLLKEAQDAYQDTSPFILAWIHTQQGIKLLRQEDYSAARLFFAAAHERFPQYVVAAEHLAETELALGNYPAALQLYKTVSQQTGHPEFFQRLAEAERGLGLEQAALQHEQEARIGYANLISRYPLMYADHAAKYYLEIGEPETALQLAIMNREARQDIGARMLLLQTQVATGEFEAACAEYQALQALGFSPPELQSIELGLQQTCALQTALAIQQDVKSLSLVDNG